MKASRFITAEVQAIIDNPPASAKPEDIEKIKAGFAKLAAELEEKFLQGDPKKVAALKAMADGVFDLQDVLDKAKYLQAKATVERYEATQASQAWKRAMMALMFDAAEKAAKGGV
jgi:hypothetical protein